MLEKILEEIEQRVSYYRDNATAEYVDACAGLREAQDIIRKRMNDDKCGECNRRKWYKKGYEDGKKDNDGWIPCDERLPDTERSVLMCNANGCRDVGWWTGKRWVTGFSLADVARDIIAWRPLPEPYRPEKGAEK